MDFFEAVARRHSYRGDFKDLPVPRADLVKIVQAGIQAPSGKNEQTTSFVIVDEPELLRRMVRIVDRPACNTAKAIIVCVGDPRPVMNGSSFETEDCAAAVENMLLAITALGYAAVWLQGVMRTEGVPEKIAELLGIPKGRNVRILLPLGVPVETANQKEKLPFEQRAWFNRWGGVRSWESGVGS